MICCLPAVSQSKELQSLELLLQNALPDVDIRGASASRSQKDPERYTHPTIVESWPGWEAEIKQQRREDTEVRLFPCCISYSTLLYLPCLKGHPV